MIDRVTTLAAAKGTGTVKLPDNKEGALGLRVIRALEDPAEKGGEFKDAAGRVTKMGDMDMSGVTGEYLSSEGKVGKDVWGTRGAWTKLSGKVGGKDVTVAILDAPGNPGYPTYWHARGYGLFAANPLGQAALSNGKDTLNFAITEGSPRPSATASCPSTAILRPKTCRSTRPRGRRPRRVRAVEPYRGTRGLTGPCRARRAGPTFV